MFCISSGALSFISYRVESSIKHQSPPQWHISDNKAPPFFFLNKHCIKNSWRQQNQHTSKLTRPQIYLSQWMFTKRIVILKTPPSGGSVTSTKSVNHMVPRVQIHDCAEVFHICTVTIAINIPMHFAKMQYMCAKHSMSEFHLYKGLIGTSGKNVHNYEH